MASYKGTTITPGTDQEIAAQVAAIDARSTPVNTVPATALGQTKGGTYSTYFPVPTASVGLAESAIATKDSYLARIASEADATAAEQETAKTGIASLFEKLGVQGRKKTNAYEKEGINDLKREIDQITSDMEARGRSYDKKIQFITENNPEGKLKSGIDIDTERLTREKASELADLAIVLNAKTRNFETAKSIIDQKVDAETEDLKTRLDGMKFFYSENASKLSKDESILLQQQISAAEREYDAQRTLRSQIGQLQLAAAEKGAGASVVSAIGKAGTLEAAIAAGGQFLVDEGVFDTTGNNAPAKTFDQFLKEKEAEMSMSIVPNSTLYNQIKTEYDQTYGSSVSTGKLSSEDKQRLAQSGLTSAAAAVQNYFLNTEPSFQQYLARQASGGKLGSMTYATIDKMYQDWLAVNGSDVGGFSAADFASP